jgi:hypothetical protein
LIKRIRRICAAPAQNRHDGKVIGVVAHCRHVDREYRAYRQSKQKKDNQTRSAHRGTRLHFDDLGGSAVSDKDTPGGRNLFISLS